MSSAAAEPSPKKARAARRGVLVVIDGPDRAGKTTAARRLEKEKGFLYVKRPDRSTETGRLLDRFIRRDLSFAADHKSNERAAQCLFAANNHEGRDEIVAALEAGRDVVADRYIPSGAVYHSVAVGEDARGFIEALNRGMPRADVVLVFEVDAAVAAKRADFGAERNDSEPVQRAVARGFREFFKDGGARFVDASRTADEVFAEVAEAVEAAADAARGAELSFYQ